MSTFCYCRVSTELQSVERQRNILTHYCQEHNIEVDKWFEDKASGKSFNRKNYQEMKKELTRGDILIVSELDRLSRAYKTTEKFKSIKEEWKELSEIGVRVIVVDMPLLSTQPDKNETLEHTFIANLVLEVLAYAAEKERENRSVKTRDGIKAKRELYGSAFRIGREKQNVPADKIEQIRQLYGTCSVAEIQRRVGLGRRIVDRVIREEC